MSFLSITCNTNWYNYLILECSINTTKILCNFLSHSSGYLQKDSELIGYIIWPRTILISISFRLKTQTFTRNYIILFFLVISKGLVQVKTRCSYSLKNAVIFRYPNNWFSFMSAKDIGKGIKLLIWVGLFNFYHVIKHFNLDVRKTSNIFKA